MAVVQYEVKIKGSIYGRKKTDIIQEFRFDILASNLETVIKDIEGYKREHNIFKIYEITIRRVK